MNETEIYGKLTAIFRDVFEDDSIEVTPDLTAKDVDGWDSLSHIRLLITIERAFKIKFSTSEIGNLQKAGDLVPIIEKRV